MGRKGGTKQCARRVVLLTSMVYNVKEIRDYIALGLNEDYNRFLSQLYLNVPTNTVAFSDSGSVSDNGVFTVTLTPESKNYLNHIDYILMTSDADGRRHTLCTDNDMNKDWENMVFRSNFRGISLALDGHRLFHSTVSTNGEYVSFNAPINVNGERMNLAFCVRAGQHKAQRRLLQTLQESGTVTMKMACRIMILYR